MGGWGFLFALQRWMRREGRVCVVILNVGVILSSRVSLSLCRKRLHRHEQLRFHTELVWKKHVFIVGWSVWKGLRKGEGMGKYVYTHREPTKLILKYCKIYTYKPLTYMLCIGRKKSLYW